MEKWRRHIAIEILGLPVIGSNRVLADIASCDDFTPWRTLPADV
jgi:hypothetical protein